MKTRFIYLAGLVLMIFAFTSDYSLKLMKSQAGRSDFKYGYIIHISKDKWNYVIHFDEFEKVIHLGPDHVDNKAKTDSLTAENYIRLTKSLFALNKSINPIPVEVRTDSKIGISHRNSRNSTEVNIREYSQNFNSDRPCILFTDKDSYEVILFP